MPEPHGEEAGLVFLREGHAGHLVHPEVSADGMRPGDRGLSLQRRTGGEDPAVVCDDLDTAEYIGLTTVRQQLVESGQVAVELLLARLADPTRARQRVQLPLEIVRRETA